MKNIVVEMNTFLLYLALIALLVTGVIMVGTVGLLQGLAVLTLGSLLWCVVSGLWFAIVAILDELRAIRIELREDDMTLDEAARLSTDRAAQRMK